VDSFAVDLTSRRRYLCWQALILSDFKEQQRMTTFDKRKEGFESKFAHDEELRFKATARRNRLVGLWAAEKLGLEGVEAEAYARSVVAADLAIPGDQDVFQKIRADFDAKNVQQSDHQIRRTMDELMGKAVEQIQSVQR
jgi:hypothetical protein